MRQVTMIVVNKLDLAQLKSGQSLLLDIGAGKQLEVMYEGAVTRTYNKKSKEDLETPNESTPNGVSLVDRVKQIVRHLGPIKRSDIFGNLPDLKESQIRGCLSRLLYVKKEVLLKNGMFTYIGGSK